MDRKELIKKLIITDLEGDMRDVADIVGIENTIKLAEYFGGTRIHFRLLGEMLVPVEHRAIRDAFFIEGKDLDTIRREFEISESTLREIIFKNGDTRQTILPGINSP